MYKETLISWHCVKFLALSAFSVRWSVFDRKTTPSSRRGQGVTSAFIIATRNAPLDVLERKNTSFLFSLPLRSLSLPLLFPCASVFSILSSAIALPRPTYGRVTLKWFIHLIKFAFETKLSTRSRHPAESQNRTPSPFRDDELRDAFAYFFSTSPPPPSSPPSSLPLFPFYLFLLASRGGSLS